MTRPKIWIELCAGSAAVAIRLVGGPNANPPIGMMGGKRGFSRAILGVLGLRQGLGADEVWLNDAGPWGPVWACLTTPGKAEEVAAIIRGWKDEEPRALWDRLKAEGWGDLTEVGEVAAWHTCCAWSAKGTEYFSEAAAGMREDWAGSGPDALASRVEAVARWLVCSGGAFRCGEPESGIGPNFTGHPGSDAFGAKERITEWLPGRLSSWPTPVRAYHGSALDVPIPEDCRGVFCYIDPPYQDTTGYQHDLPREDVIACARRWSEAGAVVCISEAVPIEIEGWHHVEIGSERVGQRRTFGGTREWLTLNRKPAWTPSVQVGLFSVHGEE